MSTEISSSWFPQWLHDIGLIATFIGTIISFIGTIISLRVLYTTEKLKKTFNEKNTKILLREKVFNIYDNYLKLNKSISKDKSLDVSDELKQEACKLILKFESLPLEDKDFTQKHIILSVKSDYKRLTREDIWAYFTYITNIREKLSFNKQLDERKV
ncbi:hypothetical protein [Lonepinella sp. BR2882]|uniref:hypothetical protein n=1 Tax=Lonepinella sp. BR2882 TaxID=3095283 RepID=UPI003F6E21F4